jgi:hypothetical protein
MMLKGQFTRWTDAKSAQIRRMWDEEGLSSGDIAYVMGITRNAVIGRVRRMGLQFRKDTKVKPRLKPRKQYEKTSPTWRQKPLLAVSLPGDTRPLLGEAWAPLYGIEPVSLVDLDPGMCKWPIGEARPYRFCGAHADGAYCEYHTALSVGQGTPSERQADRWKEAA